MGRVLRSILCIIMITAVLCLSFSTFAVEDDEEEPITGVDRVQAQEYLMAYYIYEFLNSIGITVSYKGIVEYNDYVQDTIIDWVVNYIGDLIEADTVPSTYNISTWIAPWQADYDYWGNLKYNSTMLEDLEDFAEWLESKFSLIDNNTQVVDPVYTIQNNISSSEYTLYRVNHYYNCFIYPNPSIAPSNMQNSTYINGVTTADETIDDIYYFVWQNTVDNSFNYVFVSERDYNSKQVSENVYDASLVFIRGIGRWLYLSSENSQGRYKWSNTPVYNDTYYGQRYYIMPSNMTYMVASPSELSAFKNNAIISEEATYITTREIELPSSNPNYVTGDGMIIIDGSPQYQQITFSGEITNLPAIVSTQKIDNPGIGSLFNWIPTFINMASDSMGFFKQVIYMMPDQVLVCIFAVMGSGILFGLLRLMREH